LGQKEISREPLEFETWRHNLGDDETPIRDDDRVSPAAASQMCSLSRFFNVLRSTVRIGVK
jgi:hypothetical protein